MKHGFFLPPVDELADAAMLADLAAEAEAAGWDGVFLWDHILRPEVRPLADPWVALGVMARATERVLLGPMVTPLTRRRPQKLARETVTVDRLSGGRLVLGLGLGVDTSRELSGFGEVVDARERSEMLDEAIPLLQQMWTGQPVHHVGRHYMADDVTLLPTPTTGRIPIWLAARTTNAAPLRRAAAHDGLFAIEAADQRLADMVEVIAAERGSLDGFDVAVYAPPGRDLGADEAVGVTWWMTDIPAGIAAADALALARHGPPT